MVVLYDFCLMGAASRKQGGLYMIRRSEASAYSIVKAQHRFLETQAPAEFPEAI